MIKIHGSWYRSDDVAEKLDVRWMELKEVDDAIMEDYGNVNPFAPDVIATV